MNTSGRSFGLLAKHSLVFVISIFIFSFNTPISQADELPATISGQVTQTINAAGYTYVMLTSADQTQIWVAIPKTTLEAGSQLSVIPEMEMKDFHSKTLSRTFPVIYFASQLRGEPTAESAESRGDSGSNSAEDSFAAAVRAEQNTQAPQAQPIEPSQQSGGSQGAIVPFNEIEVEKAAGPNSYRVGELFTKAESLDGQRVRVRGQVVKFNANIMGRNWLHIQDGSGDPLNNTHDLVATTSETINGPAVITIEGVISANKDFGAGYKYVVILEKGSIIENK
ncbi:MAG: DNA-binding protein [Desulfobulbaceae bacterium]|nr:MAG: DNA-binding protein [Desulfobulbaceae bacterium]